MKFFDEFEIEICSNTEIAEKSWQDLIRLYCDAQALYLHLNEFDAELDMYIQDAYPEIYQFAVSYVSHIKRVLQNTYSIVPRWNRLEDCVDINCVFFTEEGLPKPVALFIDNTLTIALDINEGLEYCMNCGVTYNLHSVAGNNFVFVCDTCIDTHGYEICDDCGGVAVRYLHPDCAIYDNDEYVKTVCDICASNSSKYKYCSYHNRYELTEQVFIHSPYNRYDLICQNGLDEILDLHPEFHYGRCCACDREQYVETYEITGKDYCYSCAGDLRALMDMKNYEGRHSYSYKPISLFIDTTEKTLYEKDNTLYLGCELELDDGNDDEIYDTATNIHSAFDGEVYCKEDGSLDNGIECVTQPMTVDKAMNFEWDNLCALASDAGCHATYRGGFHVHINKKFLGRGIENKINTAKLIVLWDRFWDEFRAIGDRDLTDGDHWAGKSRGYFEQDDSKYEIVDKLRDCDGSRYRAVNITNSDTVEFRLFAASDSERQIKRMLNIIQACVKLIKDVTFAEIFDWEWEDFLSKAQAYSYDGLTIG